MSETTDLQKLIVSLEARTKEYEKALAKAQGQTVRQLRSMEREAQGFTARFNAQLSKVGQGFTPGFLKGGLAGLFSMATLDSIREAVKSVADMADQAERINLPVADFQALVFSAHQAGVETEAVGNLFEKFQQQVGEASAKGNDLTKILEANGVAIRDSTGNIRDQKALFYDVVNLISNAKSQQEAAVIAQAAFGKAAADSLQWLQQGAGAIKDQERAARAAGAVISNDLVEAAQEFDDLLTANWDGWVAQGKEAIIEIVKFAHDNLGFLSDLSQQWGKAGSNLTKRGSTFDILNFLDPNLPGMFGVQEPKEIGSTESAPGKRSLPRIITHPTTVPDLSGGTEAAAKKYAASQQRKADAIQRVVDALKAEQAGLTGNNVDQEIANRLAQAGVTATSAQGKQIIALVKANEQLRNAQELATQSGEEMMQRYAEIKSGLADLGEQGFDSLMQIATGAGKASDVVKELLANLLDALAKGALFGSGPLGALLGGSGGGGLFSTLFSGLGGSSFAGLYASGGQIPSGKIGIAGEAGPEWIRGPANVTPIKSGGGGSSKVAITLNLAGVNGNTEVARIAREAVKQGLREYDRQRPLADVERNLRVA